MSTIKYIDLNGVAKSAKILDSSDGMIMLDNGSAFEEDMFRDMVLNPAQLSEALKSSKANGRQMNNNKNHYNIEQSEIERMRIDIMAEEGNRGDSVRIEEDIDVDHDNIDKRNDSIGAYLDDRIPVHYENSEIPNIPIRIDSNGVPVLGIELTDVDPNEDPEFISKQEGKKRDSNPILELIEKAKKEDVDVQITLKIGLIDKMLYQVILNSFGEESESDILRSIYESIPKDEIMQNIIESIKRQLDDK